MTFLYALLGVAMITSISAMMEISNSVNKNSDFINLMALSNFKNDYFDSPKNLPAYDRKILDLLKNYSGSENDVCSYIEENINTTLYQLGTMTPSQDDLFINSCSLINVDLKHRVLIKKNKLGNYNLFSCYLTNKNYCPYEEIK